MRGELHADEKYVSSPIQFLTTSSENCKNVVLEKWEELPSSKEKTEQPMIILLMHSFFFGETE
jgi:hypothetical protein